MRRLVAVLAATLVGLGGCAPAVKDLKRALGAEDAGTVWFTPDDKAVISGVLRLPAGAGPRPAVVLMHGCGGVGNAETGWEPVLRGAGYVTFLVDSLGPRGLTEICTAAAPGTSIIDRVGDAYGALAIVSTHPRVDRGRIALMGFSHGGGVALIGALAWARDRHVRAGGATFRAFLPFYPVCAARYPELYRLAGPMRIHHGEADDWTPVAPCREIVAEQRARGQDADITVYPGALHSFDNIGRAPQRLPNVRNPSGCRLELASIEAPIPPAEIEKCMTRGASIGWHPGATETARKNVLAQLADWLR